MRKLLLASAASIGATLAMTGGAMAQPVKPVAPGTLVVHVNGYIQFEIGGYGSTFNKVVVPGGKASVFSNPGVFKLNPITTDGDVRLYAGFDAQSVDGLNYGAQTEFRTTTSDANVGANKVLGSGSSAGANGLYVKRAYGYVGTVDGGYIRLGQTDSAYTLLQTGVVEAFGDGAQYNTDGGLASLLPSAASPGNFIYADSSNLYATDKIVLLSPAIAGFSAAAGYEPNSNGIKQGYGNNSTASSTSAALSSSPSITDIGKRRKNTVDAAVQYALKANGFATKVSAGVLYGAPIAYTGPKLITGAKYGFDSLQVYEVGGQTTFAGLTIGGNAKAGQVEDGYAFKPKGARDAVSFILGASYVMGPLVLGASYYNGQSAGVYTPGAKVARTLSEYGVAAGGNYVISPNMSLFVQYLYGHKHQPGATVASPGTELPADVALGIAAPKLAAGNTQVQAIGVGATIKW